MTALDDKHVVTAVSEEVDVRKRVVDKGGYRITKSVETREELLDVSLARDEYTIERRTINEAVSLSQPPVVRHEGETMIVPVLEEVLVVERKLMLKEELRVTRRRVQINEAQAVGLRSEKILVERIDADEIG